MKRNKCTGKNSNPNGLLKKPCASMTLMRLFTIINGILDNRNKKQAVQSTYNKKRLLPQKQLSAASRSYGHTPRLRKSVCLIFIGFYAFEHAKELEQCLAHGEHLVNVNSYHSYL